MNLSTIIFFCKPNIIDQTELKKKVRNQLTVRILGKNRLWAWLSIVHLKAILPKFNVPQLISEGNVFGILFRDKIDFFVLKGHFVIKERTRILPNISIIQRTSQGTKNVRVTYEQKCSRKEKSDRILKKSLYSIPCYK